MKRSLLTIALLTSLVLSQTQGIAQRYLNYVFPSASVTADSAYASNIQVLTGTPTAVTLRMDVYEPAGAFDPLTERPLIIYLHTGSFLPAVINQTPTGSRKDSSVVEMCKRFARRGFVAAAISYRVGWNPASIDQDVRTGTLLQAVYRSIQDVKACVRFFRKDADINGNTYGVDTNNIILVGQGSGGYVALAYATLDDPAEIQLPKFLSTTNNATYGFNIGFPYVNQAVLGDYEGYGGVSSLNNPNNSVGYSSEINFVCNMGGAIGDSSWLQAGDAPMVAFHVVGDPFAPYGNGPVIVPTTGDFVVNVSGSQSVITQANAYGNNNCFANNTFTDPYTTYANSVNGGQEGLFPFYTTPNAQAGPWEWFDSTSVVAVAQAYGFPQSQGTQIYQNALLTNPNMSKAKALAYIDTVQEYLVPRIVFCRGLVGIEENSAITASLQLMPNPAKDMVTITLTDAAHSILGVELVNVIGETVYRQQGFVKQQIQLNRMQLAAGIYLVKITTDAGIATRKLIFE